MNKFIAGLLLFACSFAALAASGPLFTVSGTPQSITINTTPQNHYYSAVSIKLKTPGFSIASGCTTGSNGLCIFGVSDTIPTTITNNGQGKNLSFELCLNGNGPLTCQNFQVSQQLAYITNLSGSSPYVSLCAIDPASGAITACSNAAANASVDASLAPSGGFNGIVIDNTNNIAYMSLGFDVQPYVYQCTINAQGLFSACSSTQITSFPNYQSYYGMLTINSTGTLAYLVSESGLLTTVLACPITAGVISGICTDTGAVINSSSVQIALSKDNSTAYIGNYSDPYVVVCQVSGDGLTFAPCINKNGDNGLITFTGPAGVALTKAGDMLYIADYGSSTVFACSTTPNGALPYFNSCITAGTSALGLASLNGIAVNSTTTTAYITGFGPTFVCSIDSNGVFTSCDSNTDAPDGGDVALAD